MTVGSKLERTALLEYRDVHAGWFDAPDGSPASMGSCIEGVVAEI